MAPTEDLARLQKAIDESNVRGAGELTMAEKLKLGTDLFDDCFRWLMQIIEAEDPSMTDEGIRSESNDVT
jgi:hypothetical protein